MPRKTTAFYTLIALVLTLCASRSAIATIVTVVATGTIVSGTDTTGVFIGKGASLSGQPFKLVFSFDDTKGQQTFASGVSSIVSTSTSNPGVCVMYVNGQTFTYGLPYVNGSPSVDSSEAQRYSAPNSELYFLAANGTYGDGASVQIGVYLKNSNAITDSNWEHAFSNSNLTTGTGAFEISEYPSQAGGQLSVSSVTVEGPVSSQIVFAPGVGLPTGASQGGISPMAASADFNGDGFQDLATVNLVDSSVSVLFGDGKGGFAAPVKYAVGNGPYGIASGDFNGDGKADIVVVNGNDNTVSVLLNTGSGGFPAKPNYTYAVGSEPFGVSVADLNKDGFLDLVVANSYSNTLSVLMGNGNGTFQAQKAYQTSTTPLGTAIADLNGDGYPDVVAWDTNNNSVTVLINDQTGKFSNIGGYFDDYTIPFGVAIGDFNSDGYPDIAMANLGGGGTTGQYPGNTVTVLYGNHLGNYVSFAPQNFTVGSLPTSVVATDLNGDGVLDLAVTNLGDGTVSLLLGKGDGTFMPQTTVPAGTQPYSIIAGDFNGDGKTDLAVTSFYDNTIGVLLQTTSATSSGKMKGTPKITQNPVRLR